MATSGVGLMACGLAALQAAGGIGVITGVVIVGAAGVVMAWAGLALFTIGAVITLYVAARLFYQTLGSNAATPWTKPTDLPVRQWNARWTDAPGSNPPMSDPIPSVSSSVCYPPDC